MRQWKRDALKNMDKTGTAWHGKSSAGGIDRFTQPSQDPVQAMLAEAVRLYEEANAFEEAGRLEAALDAGRRVVEIFEEITSQDPTKHSTNYANALNNLSGFQMKLERLEEAYETMRRATEVQERLYREDPETCRFGYALTLLNLTYRTAGIERYEEAETVLERSMSLFHATSDDDPVRTERYLAEGERLHGMIASSQGDEDRAAQGFARAADRLATLIERARETDLVDMFFSSVHACREACEQSGEPDRVADLLSEQAMTLYVELSRKEQGGGLHVS
jgi:tetratricopeptide (TPR) repeat protein